MNLHTTLKAYNEVNIQHEQELIINEAKAIIEQSEKSDLDILTALGMDRNIKQFKAVEREIEQSSNFDEIYDISVIEKMAIHYGLRFLPSDIYTGTIDPSLPSILNSFVSKYHISVKDFATNNSPFYILAPASSFELQAFPKDPIMFYRINENKYAFIHKWGNDLSMFRKISNYFFRTGGHFCLLFSSLLIITLCIISLIVHDGLPLVGLTFLLFNGLFATEGNFNSDKWRSTDL